MNTISLCALKRSSESLDAIMRAPNKPDRQALVRQWVTDSAEALQIQKQRLSSLATQHNQYSKADQDTDRPIRNAARNAAVIYDYANILHESRMTQEKQAQAQQLSDLSDTTGQSFRVSHYSLKPVEISAPQLDPSLSPAQLAVIPAT